MLFLLLEPFQSCSSGPSDGTRAFVGNQRSWNGKVGNFFIAGNDFPDRFYRKKNGAIKKNPRNKLSAGTGNSSTNGKPIFRHAPGPTPSIRAELENFLSPTLGSRGPEACVPGPDSHVRRVRPRSEVPVLGRSSVVGRRSRGSRSPVHGVEGPRRTASPHPSVGPRRSGKFTKSNFRRNLPTDLVHGSPPSREVSRRRCSFWGQVARKPGAASSRKSP